MEAMVVSRDFKVVGMKHTGRFTEYGALVPKASQQFLARAGEIPHKTDVEVVLYEPKRGDDHVEGFFYTCIMVDGDVRQVPPGMELIRLSGRYAVLHGDERQMGELYGFLDRWIREQGHQKEWPNGLIVEVYGKPGTYEVEVCLPLKG